MEELTAVVLGEACGGEGAQHEGAREEEALELSAAAADDDSDTASVPNGGDAEEAVKLSAADDDEPDAASAPDDSSDEDWNEASVATSSSDDEATGESVDFLWADSYTERSVREFIDGDVCEAKCLSGKEAALQQFFLSVARLTKDQRRFSLLTALSVLKEADVADRRRGSGLRERYSYCLPIVGHVCRSVFCQAYGVAPVTVKRLRKQIKDGSFSPAEHGGRLNTNARAIDVKWLCAWFTEFVAHFAEVVSIHVRRQETIAGAVKRYYFPFDFHLLPAYFTWSKLHDELLKYVAEKALSVHVPALATMRQLLTKHCPNVRIRSPRSNVCDVCAVYHAKMKAGATVDLTETLGKHTAAAHRMRLEYKGDMESTSNAHAVLIMDYSQNLTLPSVATTPSQWYFLSLWTINVFGIYLANDGVQFNYLYDKRTTGKGSDEVISLLHHFIRTTLAERGFSRLTIYADNCSGQNKNNFVVKFLLALTHLGEFEEVALKFFVKGHKKNAVDRGFGHVRKRMARVDVYTMEQLVEAVNSAAESSVTVHFTPESKAFRKYKAVLLDAYKNVPGLLKYQVFKMKSSEPGVVRCHTGPDDEPVVCSLSRRYDGITTDDDRIRVMFEMHLDELPPPSVNTEKIVTISTKIRRYIPVEYQDDSLYAAPTSEQQETARAAKHARASARKAAQNGQPRLDADEAMESDTGVPTEALSYSSSNAQAKPSTPAPKQARKEL